MNHLFLCSSCPSHYSDANLTQFDCYTLSEILGTRALPAVRGDLLIRPKDGSTQINMWCVMNCSFAHSLWFSSFFCLMSPPSPWMKFTFLGSTHAYPEIPFFLPSWLSAETWTLTPRWQPWKDLEQSKKLHWIHEKVFKN